MASQNSDCAAQKTTSTPSPPLSTQSTIAREEEQYHVLTHKEKYLLTLLVSLAATFSPLASNIYFPALNEVAEELNASHSAVALTITTYMIAQGITPSFWGPLADCLGRRQILLYTLVIFLIANFGLALSTNIQMMTVFRFLQAAGSSSTISIGAGVIADIAPADERGGFIGKFAGVRQFSMAFGPVIGGAIAGSLGFRYIFWLLLVLGGAVAVFLFLLLPETLRAVAGNGSTPLSGWKYEPVLPFCTPWKKPGLVQQEATDLPPKESLSVRSFFEPLLFLLEKDVACTLFYGAVIYTVFSMVSASTSHLLARNYHLSTFHIGLCFLPNGLGCVVGSTIAGRQLDKDFRLAENAYKYEHELPHSFKLPKGNQPDDFPLEATRLAQLPTMTAAFLFAVIIYAFSVSSGQSLVVPLVAQFVIGYSSTAVLNLNNTLTVDLYPGKSAAATAVNNLARCLLGAAGVSFTELGLQRIGAQWLFTALVGAVVLATPMAWAEATYGMKWRRQRKERLQQKSATSEAKV